MISWSPLFDNFEEYLDFPGFTNLLGFEEITEAEVAANGEVMEAADAVAVDEDEDILFQIETKVGFGGGLPHLAMIAENPYLRSETK